MEYSKDEIERVLISNEEIQKRLDELAARVNADYAGHDLLVVCILKGAVAVFADLLRRLTIPCSIDFMAISSYGSSTKSSGVVRILKDLDHGIEGKDVLIVEDIVDSGMSMSRSAAAWSSRRTTSASPFQTSLWSATAWTMRSTTATCRTSASSARKCMRKPKG